MAVYTEIKERIFSHQERELIDGYGNLLANTHIYVGDMRRPFLTLGARISLIREGFSPSDKRILSELGYVWGLYNTSPKNADVNAQLKELGIHGEGGKSPQEKLGIYSEALLCCLEGI